MKNIGIVLGGVIVLAIIIALIANQSTKRMQQEEMGGMENTSQGAEDMESATGTMQEGTESEGDAADVISGGASADVSVGIKEVKTFTVSGSNFAFSPKTLTVNQGDTVKIIFKNTGGMHDWKIDEFNAATKKIQGGQEDTIQFVADKAGTFEYYCSVGTHRQMGMVGTLTVK